MVKNLEDIKNMIKFQNQILMKKINVHHYSLNNELYLKKLEDDIFNDKEKLITLIDKYYGKMEKREDKLKTGNQEKTLILNFLVWLGEIRKNIVKRFEFFKDDIKKIKDEKVLILEKNL